MGGFWVKEIISAQAVHIQESKSRNSARKRTAETIIKTQEILALPKAQISEKYTNICVFCTQNVYKRHKSVYTQIEY